MAYLPTSLDSPSVNAKMSFRKVANCLFIFIALANGRPQDMAEAPQEASGSLPFIQFKDGGIRLNFGGYHAEAGLGGLLSGRSAGTGGGLHASVGTPWGAHAGAGLGGQLNGNDGNLGGGLYARAGLGRGRPEAAAGLGGRLDGSGRSLNPISGGLYAGATPGGQGVGVYLGGGANKGIIEGVAPNEIGMIPRTSDAEDIPAAASPDAAASGAKPAKGRTNIQIIPSKAKNIQKENQKALETATPPADASADGKAKSQDKEVRRAAPLVVEGGLVKSVYVEPASVVKSIEKNVVASASVVPIAPAVPIVPAVPIAPVIPVSNVINNTATPIENQPNVIITKPVYPRWYFRKRFWGAPRKTVYVTPTETIDSQGTPSDIVGGIYTNAVGDSGTVAVGKIYSGSLFDDIFNIPISTLSAVNQLLRNNAG